jgi:hypothetical protein
MMFLIRVAFWLSIVVLLLPTGKTPEAAQGPQIAATDVFSAAGSAVADMRQFCVRQPEACATGSQAATAFGHKAQASAKLVYDFLTDKLGNDRATPTQATAAAEPAPAMDASQNTLTAADRSPAWHGPAPRHEQYARRAG